MVFVSLSSPNHTPIKHRCPIKKSNRITPAQVPYGESFNTDSSAPNKYSSRNIAPHFRVGPTQPGGTILASKTLPQAVIATSTRHMSPSGVVSLIKPPLRR
jgi:hypothetical protein